MAQPSMTCLDVSKQSDRVPSLPQTNMTTWESTVQRSRSFGGCTTCRSRHMKCDEQRPACSNCAHAGLSCAGYEKNIFFDFEEQSASSTPRFRRPLFTESERECMSEWLTSSIPPSQVNHSLLSIDEECEVATAVIDVQIARGPFGAFKIAQKAAGPRCGSSGDWFEESSPDEDITYANDDFSVLAEDALSPSTQLMLRTMLDQSIQNPTIMDIWSSTMGSSRVQEISNDVDINISMPDTTQPTIAPTIPNFVADAQFDLWTNSVPAIIENSVPHDAVFLIKHYSTSVLRLLTPFRHSKTPWHIMFIPHTKNCLAALTLSEIMDHASLCAFYATLSMSAFSLGGVSQSHMWLNQGKAYKQRAREHAREMLRTAYSTPKTAKYKSILMALLTMVQLSMVSGNRDQTECYLLETEKMIRVKGLNRKKSRKVRLLHHCYAYERFFHESTFLGGGNSSHRLHVRRAIESSGASGYSQDNLSFHFSINNNWDDLSREMRKVKGRKEAENDLHLEWPGIWSETLYPEIFGIPETYIFLLSLMIRLAKEKDDASQEQPSNVLDLKKFFGRAKAVERCLSQLKQPGQGRHCSDTLMDATQHSLAIYFYRRIYNIDASLLQQKVVSVRDCLLRFESAGSEMAYGSARLIWPAFIAACEAGEVELQVSFSNWFKNCALQSGLRCFTDVLVNIEQIWERKREANDSDISWPEVLGTPVTISANC